MSHRTREQSISEVECGDRTPAEAEAEAAGMGWKPFAIAPHPEAFDPHGEAFWTLPMAAAWIVHRNARAVLEWWEPYRSRCREWRFREWRTGSDSSIRNGHFLEPRSPATIAGILLTDLAVETPADLEPYTMTAAKAVRGLWVALQEDRLEATGIDRATGGRVSISAEAWRDLKWFEFNERDVLRAETDPGKVTAEYVDVTVKANCSSISGLFPRIWFRRSCRRL